MQAALFDHLWQSLQFSACLSAFAWLTRRNAAQFRLWLWRLAALKFLLPFALLVALGDWLGFPVTHTSELPPALLIEKLRDLSGWFSPVWNGMQGQRLWIFGAGVLLASGLLVWRIGRQLGTERAAAIVERARLDADPDEGPPGVGFFNAALMSAWMLVALAAPLLSGAVHAALRHYDHLVADARSFRHSEVILRPARPGLGTRYRVTVDSEGVSIRNITVLELTALAYGVTPYFVRNNQFKMAGEIDWLTGLRNDIRIPGKVRDPGDFDTYALRQPITRYLARDMGIELYLNNACQPPCGVYNVVMPDSNL